jgi:hypothetical protein
MNAFNRNFPHLHTFSWLVKQGNHEYDEKSSIVWESESLPCYGERGQ